MPTASATSAVRVGIERLLSDDRPLLAGRRVALVSNPASIDSAFRQSADALFDAPDIAVVALFGPQHGFRSDLQDNMIETPHGRDERRRVPIYSLYSETREPTAVMLRGVDVLLIDLQDVGTRVYTYIYTMANCLRAAARHGVPVIVCDRPNPVGGTAVEGATLDPAFCSFVGQFPIPLRHGMTIGEIAKLFNDAFGIGATLDVIPLDGWRRGMYFDDTGLPWVLPSPNLPTLDSAIVYPGAVLFEGTMLSEGRGTTRPFELVGAPWIDGERLATAMNAHRLPGVHFRPVVFEPTFQKHAKQTCGGCQLHVTDRAAFEPVRVAVELIAETRRQNPAAFAWRQPPYEYERDKWPIDILYGSDRLRTVLDQGGDVAPLVDSWREDEEAFRRTRERYLLY
ncbi:MAG: exo-beta-N-acetylmuramidase NamZ family protein [Vicinamibacterales bacterium]